MMTLENPTAQQIKDFCRRVEESLLAASARGSRVEISIRTHTKDVKTPDYGESPIDVLHVGESYMAKFRERGFGG